MTRPVVALDANVLVPIISCDFLLTAFDLGLYEPVVSTIVLDEVESALLEDHPHLDAEAVRYRVSVMREVLEDHIVDAASAKVPDMINLKDRHVVGAALLGQATILATNDIKLSNEINKTLPTLLPMDLDQFGFLLWRQSSESLYAVADQLVAKRTKPRIERQAMLTSLRSIMPSVLWI